VRVFDEIARRIRELPGVDAVGTSNPGVARLNVDGRRGSIRMVMLND